MISNQQLKKLIYLSQVQKKHSQIIQKTFCYDEELKEIQRLLGEAVNRILKDNPAFEITNAKRIIGLRNQIIHAYDSISDENIWSIIINHLPNLKIEIENKINNNLI